MTQLTLKQKTSLKDFFEKVRLCNGEVFFKTEENDTLNLKSQLSQYLFTAAYMKKDFFLRGEVLCDEPRDMESLKSFLAD